jgi:hypothetical protein
LQFEASSTAAAMSSNLKKILLVVMAAILLVGVSFVQKSLNVDRAKLGLTRVRELLTGKAKETITALIARDQALQPESNAIAVVDKLIRYHRDLYKLVNNFVSFRDFYSRRDKAIFQAGTLYLDQRSCELCLTPIKPERSIEKTRPRRKFFFSV